MLESKIRKIDQEFERWDLHSLQAIFPTEDTGYITRVRRATQVYLSRQARWTHPDGKFDSAGRWWASDQERRSCCNRVYKPSRRHPFGELRHCRTAAHVAALFDVRREDLLRLAKLFTDK